MHMSVSVFACGSPGSYLGGLAHVVGQHTLPAPSPTGRVLGQTGWLLLLLLLEEQEAALVGERCEARGRGGEVLVEVELSGWNGRVSVFD